jgi:hypothetical protein
LEDYLDPQYGTVTDWVLFLNQYMWMQHFVDQQVGLVLNALENSAYAENTVIVFLSDHGEYAGSHGLHDKGRGVYEESIRAPFYVRFPGQKGSIAMNQMCSGVDLFGLICDLATGGGGAWAHTYPDLAPRQSMWSFLYNNGKETRVAPDPVGLPYVFHTFDQKIVSPNNGSKCHVVCMRTKGPNGAKLAFYWEWSRVLQRKVLAHPAKNRVKTEDTDIVFAGPWTGPLWNGCAKTCGDVRRGVRLPDSERFARAAETGVNHVLYRG